MPRRFANLDPTHRLRGMDDVIRWGICLTGRRRRRPPGPGAPVVEPDLGLVRAAGGPPRLTWIGHASFLGSIAGVRFLIDPVFSPRIGGFYSRHTPPGLTPGNLPPIDLLLVTHNHYDHLDRASVCALPRATPVVAPLGLGRWFRRRGFARITELERWQTAEVAGLRITLTPARHWSKRGLLDTNRTLWGGFVVAGGDAAGGDVAVYHAGDSGYFDGFREIGRRFPGLRVALLPVGAYEPLWFMGPIHMSPEQAGQAFLDLGARELVPMHWGAFQMADDPISEAVGRLDTWWSVRGNRSVGLRWLAVGETLILDE